MHIYRVYTESTIEYFVASSADEAQEMCRLVFGDAVTCYRVTNIGATGLNIRQIARQLPSGYFDRTQPPNIPYGDATWHPFIPFTVRGHFIDLALNELEHESV